MMPGWAIAVTVAIALVVLAVIVMIAIAGDGIAEGFVVVLVGAIVWILAVALPLSLREHDRWVEWCQSQGGRVTDHTDTSTVVTVNGSGQPGVGVGVSTTYYCLTADGRILDVR